MFSDPELFGSETADTEDPSQLEKYFVTRPQFAQFLDPNNSFGIVRARKGVGKSALLKHAVGSAINLDHSAFFFTGSSLLEHGALGVGTANEVMRDWREIVCASALAHVAEKIDFPKTPTELAIVRKVRPLVSQTQLLKFIIANFSIRIWSFSSREISETSSYQLLKRYLKEKRNKLWIIVDDIDATFEASAAENLRLSYFFSAARLLAHEIEELVVRVSVRLDIWTTIRRLDEALDKCDQHITDIEWDNLGTLSIIANRIRNYLEIKAGSEDPAFRTMVRSLPDDEVLDLLFARSFPWGDGELKNFNYLHRLSSGRPRWMLRVCKASTEQANQEMRYNGINIGSIRKILPAYSSNRLTDVIIEHRHQCDEIENLVLAFEGRQRAFTTREILEFIRRKMDVLGSVSIDDNPAANENEICSFLFRIEFLEAKIDSSPNEILRYEQHPHFFRASTANHDSIKWEVNPVFHQALHL